MKKGNIEIKPETIKIGNTPLKSFVFIQTEKVEVINIINKLDVNKKTSDNYSIIIIKYIKDIVAPIIVKIINESIEKGKFPEELKSSIVIPVFKDGDKEISENYRPITLTKILHKIIEKVMKNRLEKYVQNNNIINITNMDLQKILVQSKL